MARAMGWLSGLVLITLCGLGSAQPQEETRTLDLQFEAFEVTAEGEGLQPVDLHGVPVWVEMEASEDWDFGVEEPTARLDHGSLVGVTMEAPFWVIVDPFVLVRVDPAKPPQNPVRLQPSASLRVGIDVPKGQRAYLGGDVRVVVSRVDARTGQATKVRGRCERWTSTMPIGDDTVFDSLREVLSLFGLPAGEPLLIEAWFDELKIASVMAALNVGPNEVQFDSASWSVIEGQFADRDGHPVVDWPMGVTSRERLSYGKTECWPLFVQKTDAEGRFRLQVPTGIWWVGPACGPCVLSAWDEGDPRLASHDLQPWNEGRLVRLGERDVATADLCLWTNPTGPMAVAGRVNHADETAAADIRVECWAPWGERSEAFVRVTTDADGRFEIPGLPKGRYFVRAWTERASTGAHVAEPDSSLVELTLQPTRFVIGRVTIEGSGEPCDASVRLAGRGGFHHVVGSGVAGVLTIGPLSHGTHDVLIASDESMAATWVRRLEVSDETLGETLEVSLQPGARLIAANRSLRFRAWQLSWDGQVVDEGRADPLGTLSWVLPPGTGKLEWIDERGERHERPVELNEGDEQRVELGE